MKKIVLSLAAVMLAVLFAPQASAIPAFARQMGKACSTCHFQHFPALNDFGRSFKAGGFVDMGKQSKIEKEGISLPGIMNASLFFKFRYQKTNGNDLPGFTTDPVTGVQTSNTTLASGDFQIPDEFALLIGGRVGKNVGFMFEGQLADGAAPLVAGFKIPFMYGVGEGETRIGVVPFITDALGAAYGFELLNTGSVRNVRVSEHRSETSAQQYIGTATPASGLALVVNNPLYYVNYTRYSPHEPADVSGSKMNLSYLRAAVTPTLMGFDVGAGVQYWFGTAADNTLGVGADKEYKAYAIDAQAQGAVAGMPLGVYLAYARAPKSSGAIPNAYNAGTAAKKAATILAELGVLPGVATVQIGYRNANDGVPGDQGDDAVTVGGTYQIAQNIQLQLQHSSRQKKNGVGRYDGTAKAGDNLTTFMLSGGL